MDSKALLVDWQTDVVPTWFNSTEPGGFLSIVTENDLYNNFEELGIIAVNGESFFKKQHTKSKVREWFNKFFKKVKKYGVSSRVVVYRGCTPQQNLLFGNCLTEFVKKTSPDESTLRRLADRYMSHFVNVSEHVHFSEGFFNEYVGEIFNYLKLHSKGAVFVDSETLEGPDIEAIAVGFYPYTINLLTEHLNPESKLFPLEARPQEYSVNVLPSNDWFMALFKESNIKMEEIDSSSAQILEYARLDVTKKLEAAL